MVGLSFSARPAAAGHADGLGTEYILNCAEYLRLFPNTNDLCRESLLCSQPGQPICARIGRRNPLPAGTFIRGLYYSYGVQQFPATITSLLGRCDYAKGHQYEIFGAFVTVGNGDRLHCVEGYVHAGTTSYGTAIFTTLRGLDLTLEAVGNSLSVDVDIQSGISINISLPPIDVDIDNIRAGADLNAAAQVSAVGVVSSLSSVQVSLGSVAVSLSRGQLSVGGVQVSLLNSLAGVQLSTYTELVSLQTILGDEVGGLNVSLVAELEEQLESQRRGVTLASLLVATLAAQYRAQTVAANAAQSAAVSALFKQNAAGVIAAGNLSANVSAVNFIRQQNAVLNRLLTANITGNVVGNNILNSLRIDSALNRFSNFNSAHANATLVTIARQQKTVLLSANVLAATANTFLEDIKTAILAGNAVRTGSQLDVATLTALAAVNNAQLSAGVSFALLATGSGRIHLNLRALGMIDDETEQLHFNFESVSQVGADIGGG